MLWVIALDSIFKAESFYFSYFWLIGKAINRRKTNFRKNEIDSIIDPTAEALKSRNENFVFFIYDYWQRTCPKNNILKAIIICFSESLRCLARKFVLVTITFSASTQAQLTYWGYLMPPHFDSRPKHSLSLQSADEAEKFIGKISVKSGTISGVIYGIRKNRFDHSFI